MASTALKRRIGTTAFAIGAGLTVLLAAASAVATALLPLFVIPWLCGVFS